MTFVRILKKFRLVLSQHQKMRIIELGILMVIGGFMEMVSVSLMLPFMEAVMTPDKIMANSFVQWICSVLGLESYRTFLVLVALCLAVIYILKNIFLLFQMYVQNRFVYNNMFVTQARLLISYLSRPYEYYLGANSGEILRVIQNDTQAAFGLLMSVLSMITEMIVSMVLIGTIFFIAPQITLSMAVLLLIILFVIMHVLRPILRQMGIENQNAAKGMNQWLLQSIQGIRELKIMRKEKFFEKNFNINGKIYVSSSAKYNTFGLLPRYVIEAASMSSLFIVVAIMIYNGTEFETMVPMLSSVAIAAIRLLPAVNRISQNMASVAYQESMLDKMIENLCELENCENKRKINIADILYVSDGISEKEQNNGRKRIVGIFEEEIELFNATYHYPTGNANVLTAASMKIQKGQSVGIVGSSGAGKTTVVDILLGLLKPQEGMVVVDGMDIQLDMNGWLAQVGYIPQQIFLLDGNIRDNVAFGIDKEEVDDQAVWTALREASLEKFVQSLPDGLDTQLGERGMRLSGGQRQRIGIARALYMNPSVLFFDEATSALDTETEAAIMESINQLHGTKTMVIIAHRLSTIEGCDRIYRVENGRILLNK